MVSVGISPAEGVPEVLRLVQVPTHGTACSVECGVWSAHCGGCEAILQKGVLPRGLHCLSMSLSVVVLNKQTVSILIDALDYQKTLAELNLFPRLPKSNLQGLLLSLSA